MPPPHAILQAVLPNKQGQLQSVKLAAPRREVLYLLDGSAVLVDVTGKTDLMPTICALWRVRSVYRKRYQQFC